MISGFLLSKAIWDCAETPPKTVAVLTRVNLASALISSLIWARQFASRSHDQHARPAPPLCRHEALQHGKREGRGLSGTGLGKTQDVAPFQRRRNGVYLNRVGG